MRTTYNVDTPLRKTKQRASRMKLIRLDSFRTRNNNNNLFSSPKRECVYFKNMKAGEFCPPNTIDIFARNKQCDNLGGCNKTTTTAKKKSNGSQS